MAEVTSSTLQGQANGSGDLTPDSPSVTILPYTTGLAGVSITTDNISSRSLWATLSFMFLVIILVRLYQRGNAHLRHLTSLGSSSKNQQTYWAQNHGSWWPWLKRHLLWAPLYKKRHNREYQLSKAVNMGTLPSRLHTLLLTIYLLSNIGYCLMLDYGAQDKYALLAEVRGRTGHLAVINMVGLFLLAGRNNPLISLLHVSFDTFNLFHRWIGRIIILQSLAHTIAWAINKHAAEGWAGINSTLALDAFSTHGLVATVAMCIIFIQASSVVRHAFYETFLHIHQLLAFATLLGVYVHARLGPLPQMPYVIAIVTLWAFDRLTRWIRLIYRNYSFSRGLTTVTIEALPADACRLTFDLGGMPWRHHPGCHVYVYIPALSLWMSHPFSVAWATTRPTPYLSLEAEKLPSTSHDLSIERPDPSRQTTSISLVCAKRTGFTAKLYNAATASPTGILRLRGLLEGPYGGFESLHSYGTVVLFAGGVGITHQLGHVKALLAANLAESTACRRILLVWTVRVAEQLDWVRPWMDEILGMENRREVLKVALYVTRPKNSREVSSRSTRVTMFPGRPKPGQIVRTEFEQRVGAMVVGVCGPGALADDVRDAARDVVDRGGSVDFWEEGFTW